jgi:hypothetical protein
VFVIGSSAPKALLGAALVATLACVALPARADSEAITLDYDAGAGCPDRKEFVVRVHSFTSKAEIVTDDGAPRRKFGVQVSHAANSVQGELTIDDRGAKTTRHVSGKTCDEVISALALATAIAVDPDALGDETAAEPAAPKATEPAPPAKARPVAPVPKSPAPPVRTPLAPKKPPGPAALYISVGARAGDAMSPSLRFEGAAEFGVTYFAPLELYVGGAYGPAQSDSLLRMSDWLGWLGADYHLLDLEPISVMARAGFEAGQTRASATSIANSETVQNAWAAVDVGLAARVQAAGPLFFQANFDARAPVTLQGYHKQDMSNAARQDEIYQVRRLGYLIGLSAGMHFL